MSTHPTPKQILETLLPHLKVAAGYAQQIQARIVAQPEKENAGNRFAAALTDADLSVQTFVEVALLNYFPHLRFFGEEHQLSYNTKYFRAIDLGAPGDYLVTLDPIDGTRFYLDGHSNYQIILTVLNADDYEAAIALSPAQNTYYYALRGGGAWRGTFADALDDCHPLTLNHTDLPPAPQIFLGSRMGALAASLKPQYGIVDVAQDYSKSVQISNLNGLLNGDFVGAALAYGNFIDGAALAFIAQEAGCIVTGLEGEPLRLLCFCNGYQRPGLLIATSSLIHRHLLDAQATALM